jgi:hypothetical protein
MEKVVESEKTNYELVEEAATEVGQKRIVFEDDYI